MAASYTDRIRRRTYLFAIAALLAVSICVVGMFFFFGQYYFRGEEVWIQQSFNEPSKQINVPLSHEMALLLGVRLLQMSMCCLVGNFLILLGVFMVRVEGAEIKASLEGSGFKGSLTTTSLGIVLVVCGSLLLAACLYRDMSVQSGSNALKTQPMQPQLGQPPFP